MQDVKYAFRQMRSHPGFTVTAVLTIALGIGANTAIFSLLYAVFWAPSYHPAYYRTVVVWDRHPEIRGNGPQGQSHISRREYLEWQRLTTSFENISANGFAQMTLNDEAGYPERMQVQPYTPGRLAAWGAPFVLGRDFVPEEGAAEGQPAVILTNRYWLSRYEGDPDILGKQLRLDGVPYTIVGVLAPGFWDKRREVLISSFVVNADQPQQDVRQLTVLAVLKPNVTIEQAQAEMAMVNARLAEEYPEEYAGWTTSLEPARNAWLSLRTRANLWLLMATVTMVLLIACVNVANLQLARGDARLKEIAVRGALGASKWQIVRQLLTESVVLSAVGGIAGIGLSLALIKIFLSLAPAYSLPPDVDVRLYPPVLLFTIGTTLAAGLFFGLAPAWQAARRDVGERLKQANSRSGQGHASHRLGKLLVVSEFALALTLLAGASLVMQRYLANTYSDFGIVTDNILTFDIPVRYDRFRSPDDVNSYNTMLTERLSALPGVAAVAPVSGMPLDRSGGMRFFLASKGEPATPGGLSDSRLRIAGPGFFDLFGIQLLQGRTFNDQDRPASPIVAVVNETFVKKHLEGLDPFSETIVAPNPNGSTRVQIVGVYRDIDNAEQLGGENFPEIIATGQQFQVPFGSFAMRTAGDPGALIGVIAAAVQEIDAEMPLTNVRTMKQIIQERTAFDRFEAALYGSFGFLSLLLAAIGIYGVMAFVVSQRTAEIGARMAFGADRGNILSLVLTGGLKLALAGIALGLFFGWQATRLLQSQVEGAAGASSLWPVAVAALVLAVAALTASYVPARRAAGLDPMAALRED